MNVLVTGATGFVGSAVVRALRRHEHRVLGLVRERERGRPLEALGASLAVGDMWRPDTYAPLVAQVEAVIHTAQEKPRGRWGRRKIRAMHQSDALMTRTLADACLRQDRLLVYTSGAMAHPGQGEEWIDETTPLRPCLLARGHAEMVEELTDLHRRRGLRLLIITPGFVYGPGGFLQETVELLRRRRYRVIGTGTNYWGLVHVDDLGEAYVLALERDSSGANYFVSDDVPLTRRAVIDLVTDALGLPRVGHVPGWLVGLFLGFPLVEAINASIRMRNDRVKQLGWIPRYTSFAEGLPPVLADIRQRLSPCEHET
jgi:nucleoside-diphosphate-sugar epimerase